MAANAAEFAKTHRGVTVLSRKLRGGKSSAMNMPLAADQVRNRGRDRQRFASGPGGHLENRPAFQRSRCWCRFRQRQCTQSVRQSLHVAPGDGISPVHFPRSNAAGSTGRAGNRVWSLGCVSKKHVGKIRRLGRRTGRRRRPDDQVSQRRLQNRLCAGASCLTNVPTKFRNADQTATPLGVGSDHV